jgi:hypothetical protein
MRCPRPSEVACSPAPFASTAWPWDRVVSRCRTSVSALPICHRAASSRALGAFVRGSDDRFSVSSLTPGRWLLLGHGGETGMPSDGKYPWWAQTEVVVGDEDVFGVALHFLPGSRVSGQLIFRNVHRAPPDATKFRISLVASPTIAGVGGCTAGHTADRRLICLRGRAARKVPGVVVACRRVVAPIGNLEWCGHAGPAAGSGSRCGCQPDDDRDRSTDGNDRHPS